MIKLLIIAGCSIFGNVEKDSIGKETINGKVFVLHKVSEKETLFAISRRYRVTVDDIVQYNAAAASGLEVGQILKVPYVPRPTRPADAIIHKVATGETLFSISKNYGVSLADIRQWNNMTDNTLSVGQELFIKKGKGASVVRDQQNPKNDPGTHVVSEKETLYSIARKYGITVDQLRSWNSLQGNEVKIGQILVVAGPQAPAAQVTTRDVTADVKEKTPTITSSPIKPAEATPKSETITISESVRNTDEIVEGGLAELIEGTEGNRKYLALHRTAPVGTILKVRNEMNNREVFVRVMGKLPDTALTDKVVVRISKSAYDRLGAIDPRFRVEVTYYK